MAPLTVDREFPPKALLHHPPYLADVESIGILGHHNLDRSEHLTLQWSAPICHVD